jgi:large subunit ribosomal protein L27e
LKWKETGSEGRRGREDERRKITRRAKQRNRILTPAFQVVIIQPVDTGSKTHPYGHALVAGIERYPSKITRRMSKTRQEKRSKVKPFIKVINYNHLMPTRYTLELEGLKAVLNQETFKEVSQREEAKKTVKKVLEERYTSGKNRWFFTPLRTSLPATRRHRNATRNDRTDRDTQAFDRFFPHNWLGGANGFFGLYTAFITE